jgi:hypothetical protein
MKKSIFETLWFCVAAIPHTSHKELRHQQITEKIIKNYLFNVFLEIIRSPANFTNFKDLRQETGSVVSVILEAVYPIGA